MDAMLGAEWWRSDRALRRPLETFTRAARGQSQTPQSQLRTREVGYARARRPTLLMRRTPCALHSRAGVVRAKGLAPTPAALATTLSARAPCRDDLGWRQ